MTESVQTISKFLYLNNLGLTLPQDQKKYNRLTSSLYKREAFRLLTFGFLCTLYNLANMPSPPNPLHKLVFFGGLTAAFGMVTFIDESKKLNTSIQKLDQKYHQQYLAYILKHSEPTIQS